MPVTFAGLSVGMEGIRIGATQGSQIYIRALTSANVVLGQSDIAAWEEVNMTSDGSAYKARDYLRADTVINITTTGVVAKLQFIHMCGMAAPAFAGGAGTEAGIRFDITLDSTLSVVSGGYLTVKGGSSTNTYTELQSSKSA